MHLMNFYKNKELGWFWNVEENCYENPSTLNLIRILSLLLSLLMDMSWIVMKRGMLDGQKKEFLKIHQALQMRLKGKSFCPTKKKREREKKKFKEKLRYF